MFQIIFFGVCLIFYHAQCSSLFKLGDYPSVFNLDDYPKLIKEPNKNFTILNLADVQVDARNSYSKSYDMITTLVERHHPDLITLTGDQIYGQFTTAEEWITTAEKLFPFIDSFGIPWAPMLGNHDYQGGIDWDTLLKMYAMQSNCIFQRGPAEVDGEGNYIVNIFENGMLYKSLIILDSHGSSDYLTQNQLNWYDWVVHGIKSVDTEVQSILFFHIPLQEWKFGYQEWKDGGFNDTGFGERNEEEAISKTNSGLFKLVVEDDHTKHIVVGHDHINNYSVMYQGVRLTYTLKTGPAAYYNARLQGGTIINLNEGVDIYHSYVV